MAEGIGKTFVTAYYQTFDADRSTLRSLYVEDSELIFEGTRHVGPDAIVAKLLGLPFSKVAHSVSTIDCALVNNLLVVVVSGQLKADDDPVHSFSQTFILEQIGDSLFVKKDIFRLSLHHQ